MVSTKPRTSESFWSKSQSALACSSGVGWRGGTRRIYCITLASFLPGRSPQRISPREYVVPDVAGGKVIHLLTTKSKWSPSFTADNSSLFSKSLHAGIDERKRITNLREVVAPTHKLITNFGSSHWATGIFVKGGQNEIRPSDFCLNLLPKRILKSYFGRLQLCDFYIQLLALVRFLVNFCPYFPKGVLEGLCHGYIYNYTLLEHIYQA